MSTPTTVRTVMSDARITWARIPVGAKVLLRFGQRDEVEEAIFLGVSEDSTAPAHRNGDNKIATFRSPETGETLSEGVPTYEWAAYRYMGRWVYGSGADTINVVAHEAEACPETDAFSGQCTYAAKHKTVCRFEGGDEDARHAFATAAFTSEQQERIAKWESEDAARALLKEFRERGIAAGIQVQITVLRRGVTLHSETVGSD